jgi:molecular chaperone DnaK
MAADNKTLGRFELVGLPPAPRGVPQIEVTFDIDADGVVNVSAVDLGTGKSQAIRVTASSGLSESEIENLVQEAEEHSQVDKQRRDLVELRNQADGLIYSTGRTLEEFADNIAEEEAKTLREALEKTREAMDVDDSGALRTAIDELSALTYKMTESLYAELSGEDGEGGKNDEAE